jgi:hypothetical protein
MPMLAQAVSRNRRSWRRNKGSLEKDSVRQACCESWHGDDVEEGKGTDRRRDARQGGMPCCMEGAAVECGTLVTFSTVRGGVAGQRKCRSGGRHHESCRNGRKWCMLQESRRVA